MTTLTPYDMGPISSFTTAHQKVDEEIAQLEARIIALQTTRNTFAPISRLHPEITQEIFLLTSRSSTECGRAALTITWVCHSWRALAHETSVLWSYIDFLNPIWLETALSRTRNHELDFSLLFPKEYRGDTNRIASLSLENLHRISTLSIRSAESSLLGVFPRFSPLWLKPAPVLVHLHLSRVSLPRSALAGTFPALRILSLNSCEFSWDCLPVQTGIRSLDISKPVSKTSVEDVMHKIQIVGSEVEQLSFHQVLLPAADDLPTLGPKSSITRKELANIKSLEFLDEQAQPITWILDQLFIPSSLASHPDIRLVIRGSTDQYDTIRSLVTCRGLEKWPIEALEINWIENFAFLIMREKWEPDEVDSGIEGLESELDASPSARISLVFAIENTHDVVSFLGLLPLQPIQDISLSGGTFRNQGSTLYDHFAGSESVRLLRIALPYLPTFTRIIHEENQQLRKIIGHDHEVTEEEMDDERKRQCREIITFHWLEALHIYGKSADDSFKFSRRHYIVLRDWLRWRQLVGFKLEVLAFSSMKIPSQDDLGTLFGELVPDIDLSEVQESTYSGAFQFRC